MSHLLIRLALLSHLKYLVLVSINLAVLMSPLAEQKIKASLQTCFYAKLPPHMYYQGFIEIIFVTIHLCDLRELIEEMRI